MTKKLTAFLAHPKSMASVDGEDTIVKAQIFIHGYFTEKYRAAYPDEDIEVDIVLGRDDFASWFDGAWDVWTKGVPARRHVLTRRFVYDCIVVLPPPQAGKIVPAKYDSSNSSMQVVGVNLPSATGSIVERAMNGPRKLPVFVYQGAGTLHRAEEIKSVDATDYFGGWLLTFQEKK